MSANENLRLQLLLKIRELLSDFQWFAMTYLMERKFRKIGWALLRLGGSSKNKANDCLYDMAAILPASMVGFRIVLNTKKLAAFPKFFSEVQSLILNFFKTLNMSSKNTPTSSNSNDANVVEVSDMSVSSSLDPSIFYQITGRTKRRSSLQPVSRDF